ncbi:MAG: S8 family serine peptidase, partial [Candidatus Methylomirabilis sp.]|nr:S8 family serine peptidase [Deltaproteobacteria bacterium]
RILPVRVAEYPKRRIESLATLDRILTGLEYVLDARRRCDGVGGAAFRVVHLGLTREAGSEPAPLGEMLDVLREDGMLLVVPAGNHANDVDGGAPEWPAAYESENLLVATGVRRKGFLEKYVNRGRASVDLAAPSSRIVSLASGGEVFGGYDGTSFASAQTAGAAALLLSCFDGLDPASIKTALERTVTPKANLPVRWAGTLDAGEAVAELARAGWCGPNAKAPPKVAGLPERTRVR